MRKYLLWLVPLLVACGDDSGAGPVPITCAAGGGAQQRAAVVNLQPGESATFLTSAAVASCLEIEPQANSRYILSVLNVDPAASASASLTIHGGPPSATVASRTARVPARPNGAAALRAWLPGTREYGIRGAERLHRALLDADRRMVARRGGPAAALARARSARGAARLDQAGVSRAFTPQLDDTLSFHIRDIDNDLGDTVCVRGFDVRARTVFIGEKTILFEDIDSPVSGEIDSFYRSIGAEFDNIIYPMVLEYFGDPLAYDPELGAKGKVLMLFSPVVNQKFDGVAGFVSGCDFYPYDSLPGPDQNTVGNDAAIFYAFVPEDAGADAVERWQGFVRGVLAHETKHIASYAAKFANGATALEDTWLEESTAQLSSEIYQRNFSHSGWKNHTTFLQSVGCEPPLTARNGCTGDHPQVMLHHFTYLYDYLDKGSTETPIGSSGEANYGGGWSFVRWTVDEYASSESEILHAMTQSTNTFGVNNLVSRVSAEFPELVADWSLASAVAGIEGFTPQNALLTFPSWEQGDVFRGMHNQLILVSSGDPAFPLVYPVVPDTLSFGTFDVNVNSLHGGGAAFFDLRSIAAERQPIEITTTGGLPLASDSPVRTAIVRVK